MTTFQKVRLVVVITVAVIAGITGGWEVGLGVILLVGLVLGFWVVIATGVDTAVGRWEGRTGDGVRNWPEDADYTPSDPTGPDDEPVIQIDTYRRHREELGRGK